MGASISGRKIRLSLKVALVATLLGAWVIAHQVPAVADPGKNAHVQAFAQLLNEVAPKALDAEGPPTLFTLRSLAPHLRHRISAKDPSGSEVLLDMIKQQDDKNPIRISNPELREHLFAAPHDGAELDKLIELHVQGLAAARETTQLADVLSVLVVVLTWPATHADLGERQQWTDADQKKWAGRVAEREKDLASLERMAAVLAVNSRDGARLSDGGGWHVAKGVHSRLNNSYEWFRWRNVVVPLLLAADFDNPTWLKPRPRKDKEGKDIPAEWVLQRDSEGLIEEWYRGVMDYWQSRADANAGIWAQLNGGKEPLRPDLLKSLIEPVHDPLNQSPPAPPLLLHPALPIQDERKKQSWVKSQAQLSPIIAAWLNSKDPEVLQLVRASNGSSKSFSSDPVVLSQKGRRITQDSFKRWEAAAERRYPARLWELRDFRPQGSDAFNTYFRRKDPLPVKDHHDFLLSEPVRNGFAQDVYQNGIPPQATELRELYQEHRLVYDLNGVVQRPKVHELELWGRLDYLAPFEPFVDVKDGNGLWTDYPHLRSAYYAATGMSSHALPEDSEIASNVMQALETPHSPFLTRAATVVMIHQMTFTASGYGVPDKPATDLARTLTSPHILYRSKLKGQLVDALGAFNGDKPGVSAWSPLPLAFVVLDLMLADAAGSLNGFDEGSLGAYPTEDNQWQSVGTVAAASDKLSRRYITKPTEALAGR